MTVMNAQPDYLSTRGDATEIDFETVLLSGLAPDGGLYVPAFWPKVSPQTLEAWKSLSYADLAVEVMALFVEKAVGRDELRALVRDAYSGFDTPDVAPLVPFGNNEYLMELFHGPTLAFKDYAMQVLCRLFDTVLTRRGERITIIGATSGDTGAAAVAACRDRAAMEIFMLHPKGRVSPVQQRQMTSVDAPNVYNIAVNGTFDDCQDLVKALFNDAESRRVLNLSAVNSINWARVMAQIVYYFWAALKLGAPGRAVAFAVPTGNFGNVYAGYAAHRMGLPVAQLIVGSNRNDILTRFFDSGVMDIQSVHPTLSPSMDIQVSSNFERLLFDLLGRDGGRTAAVMTAFREEGRLEVTKDQLASAKTLFDGFRQTDEDTLAQIGALYRETNGALLVDPHTAVGVAAGRARRRDADVPLVHLSTAHPAKFPDAVERASGVHPALPPALADLYERPEFFAEIDNDFGAFRSYVHAHAGKLRAPGSGAAT